MSDEMEISLIRPSLNGAPLSDAMQPLAFAILSSLTPPDIQVSLWDERVEGVAYDHPTDLVALTVETYTARRAYQIAARFRERGVPVIMGGYHPTLAPKEALQYADAIVIGDAEDLWEQIVRDAQTGRLERIYRQQDPSPLRGLKPDRSIFRGKRYAPIIPVQYGRGCPFACDFCSIHAFYGNHLRQRPVHEVVAEIEELGRKYIFVVDDNIFVDVPKARELFRALAPLNIRWACQADIGITQNTELLDLMAKSGCIAMILGFESLTSSNLRQMRKRQNPGDYATAIQKLQDRGIMIYGTFVFGYDADTVDSFDATVEFALRHKFCLANFNPLTPTPGTRLYERLHAQGRLIYERWWLDPSYRYGQATFHPRGMTAEQLTEGCYHARRQFNRYSSVFKRALSPRTNCRSAHHLAAFVISNLISRKEIHGKQGQRLGSDAPLAPFREAP
jgi:radical SAM superfamily enzyme YgiQ (UPF0313 family)